MYRSLLYRSSSYPSPASFFFSSSSHRRSFSSSSSSSPSSLSSLRHSFLDYFSNHPQYRHRILPSSSVIPPNDPSLLFTSAGMVPLKEYFLSPSAAPSPLCASVQRCIRAGGKHNDLDAVGVTARHHTLFEMLGNFSFGEYQSKTKEIAISLSWNYLTKVLKIPTDRLSVTVFESDDESAEIWKSITGWNYALQGDSRSPEELWESGIRITRRGAEDNFWSMGDTGPCGPCTEIFYDQQQLIDGERHLEIWNLVFMQYERQEGGILTPLAAPCLDTGMGLERLASVMQGVKSNYDIDILRSLAKQVLQLAIQRSKDSSETSRQNAASSAASLLSQLENNSSYSIGLDRSSTAVATKVIVDHIRAIAFLISDGVLPSNVLRGYVLRRIIRRAIRFGATKLGFDRPFLHLLVEGVVKTMGDQYTDLINAQQSIISVLRNEESIFFSTLHKGLKVLDELFSSSSKSSHQNHHNKRIVPGDLAFLLYDSFGFPLDVTQMIAAEQGWKVDNQRFDELMNKQKSMSRASWIGSGDHKISLSPAPIFRLWQQNNVQSTFTGYERMEEKNSRIVAFASMNGQINRIFNNDGSINRFNSSLPGKDNNNSVNNDNSGLEASNGWLVLDPCPFYAQGGGQVGDCGLLYLEGDRKKKIHVLDCIKAYDGCSVLRVSSDDVDLINDIDQLKGKYFHALVDDSYRQGAAAHHTATHLLHSALKQILSSKGAQVVQAGSLVTPDRLRFDFSSAFSLTADDINQVERWVNDAALSAVEVNSKIMPKKEAEKLNAVALFGEKYGDQVRVVDVASLSKELCGGTHVSNTRSVYPFKIISEGSVAAGTRRIEAVAGKAAVDFLSSYYQRIRKLSLSLKINPNDLENKIDKMRERIDILEKQVREESVNGTAKKTINSQLNIEGGQSIPFYCHYYESTGDVSHSSMKEAAIIFSQSIESPSIQFVHHNLSGITVLIADESIAKSHPEITMNTLWKSLSLLIEPKLSGGKIKGGGNSVLVQGTMPGLSSIDNSQQFVTDFISSFQWPKNTNTNKKK